MYLKNNSYKHEESTFIKALGIKSLMATMAREKIFFASITNALQAYSLYGIDLENAPHMLKTATGDLEKCVKLLNNEEEYTYTLLNFHNYHKLSTSMIKIYIKGESNELTGEEKIMYEMLKLASKISFNVNKSNDDLNDDVDDIIEDSNSKKLINQLDPIKFFKRIEFVKESKYNFNDYIKLLGKNFNDEELLKYIKESTKDVDTILNNIFTDSSEE